jgi:hypothetical protein
MFKLVVVTSVQVDGALDTERNLQAAIANEATPDFLQLIAAQRDQLSTQRVGLAALGCRGSHMRRRRRRR